MTAIEEVKTRVRLLDYLSAKLELERDGSRRHKARCPFHPRPDNEPSFVVYDEQDRWHCFGCNKYGDVIDYAGHELYDGAWNPRDRDQLATALRALGVDMRLSEGGGVSTPGDNTTTLQHSPGCTIEAYADKIGVPVPFLRSLGCSQINYLGAPAVRIPHYSPDGSITATLFRVSLSGNSKRWKSGDKATLYGLDRLYLARERMYLPLVEGQSDCHTLWYVDEPALGLPGAGNGWDKLTEKLLEGIPTIYVLIEPDAGGETVLRKLRDAPWRHRARLVRLPDGYKDPSALYEAAPGGFSDRWRSCLEAAEPWKDVERRESDERASGAWELCREIATAPDILALVARTVAALGVAGETRLVKLLYLAVVSRLLDGNRPVSLAVKGPSSGGKSHTTQQVLSLFPASAYYALSAMSEQALAYSEEPLSHRMLVIYEAAGMSGDFASYLLRSLLSEGSIRYETVEKTADGLKAQFIERLGPTGLIVTTTALQLHPENETRILSVPVSDTPDQTRAVLLSLAGELVQQLDLAPWHSLSEWLEAGERRVNIPFARELAEHTSTAAVRLRRDFVTILSLTRAHALLHRASREQDADGRIVAIVADYAAVRELVHDLIADGVGQTVPATIRETVRIIAEIGAEAGASIGHIAKALKLDKSVASRRARAAQDRGYLQNLEDRKGRPARYVLGEPMPEDVSILPMPEALQCCSVDGGDSSPPPPTAVDQCDDLLARYGGKHGNSERD